MTVQAQAVVQRKKGDGYALVDETTKLPELEEHQVLVKVASAALNPTDAQSFDGDAFGDGAVLGCDFAGTVEKTASNVSKLKNGDKVAALVWGGKFDDRNRFVDKR